ncbi:MAG: hypothetical protein IT286_02160 [Proteobacteria bacterium]|nr:hypothetical protein [Pseudomonadota bacterium]
MFNKKALNVTLSTILFSTAVFAQAQDLAKPEFAFIPETGAQSSFQAQVGGGMLDDASGASGSPIYVLIKANYQPNDDTSLFIDLPMAGTISSGADDFGIGNISMGGNHRLFENSGTSFAVGANFTFPTSQNRARVGAFTRNFYSFIQDQYAISPYLNLSFSKERMLISFDAGLNQQIFQTQPAGFNKFESTVFYDAGLSMAVNGPRDIWATLEFGGYSNLTYASNETVLFGGPGIRYQDDEKSFGVHLQAPFSSPARDVIDLLVMVDTRFKF